MAQALLAAELADMLRGALPPFGQALWRERRRLRVAPSIWKIKGFDARICRPRLIGRDAVPNLSHLEIPIAAIALAIPLVLIPAVPRRGLRWAILLWALSPVIGYVVVLFWEVVTSPSPDNSIGVSFYRFIHTFYGFLTLSPLLILPWAVLCAAGIGIGLLMRRIVRTRAGRSSR